MTSKAPASCQRWAIHDMLLIVLTETLGKES